jgi:DNA-binding beta-propeller fold protein YncE
VTDAGNSAVQVIDPATQEVTGHIAVGSGTIMHMTGHEKKSRLWVVNNTAKTITEINANNNNIVYTLQLAFTPHDIAVNANGTKLYVSLNNGGEWQVYTYSTDLEATGDYQLVDSRAFGSNWLHLYFSSVHDKLYAADQGLGKFWALNPDDLNATAASVAVPGAHGLTLSADEAYSYVASISENKIYVVNNATNTIVSSITSTLTPAVHNLAINDANDLLLGTHSGASSTNVSTYSIDGGVLTQGATISSGLNPMAVAYYKRRAK